MSFHAIVLLSVIIGDYSSVVRAYSITHLFTYRVAAFSNSFSAVQDDVSANSHDSAISAAHFECRTITLYVVHAFSAIVD